MNDAWLFLYLISGLHKGKGLIMREKLPPLKEYRQRYRYQSSTFTSHFWEPVCWPWTWLWWKVVHFFWPYDGHLNAWYIPTCAPSQTSVLFVVCFVVPHVCTAIELSVVCSVYWRVFLLHSHTIFKRSLWRHVVCLHCFETSHSPDTLPNYLTNFLLHSHTSYSTHTPSLKGHYDAILFTCTVMARTRHS